MLKIFSPSAALPPAAGRIRKTPWRKAVAEADSGAHDRYCLRVTQINHGDGARWCGMLAGSRFRRRIWRRMTEYPMTYHILFDCDQEARARKILLVVTWLLTFSTSYGKSDKPRRIDAATHFVHQFLCQHRASRVYLSAAHPAKPSIKGEGRSAKTKGPVPDRLQTFTWPLSLPTAWEATWTRRNGFSNCSMIRRDRLLRLLQHQASSPFVFAVWEIRDINNILLAYQPFTSKLAYLPVSVSG